jgi:endoglucanase
MSPAADTSPEAKSCGARGLIDDTEDNDHQVAAGSGRNGYWYTFVDKAGSSITPMAGEQGGVFAMAPGGANGSAFAAHMTGKVGTGDIVYAGMGVNFADPKGQYDASAFKGVAFYAKKGQGSGKVRLKVPDVNTDPEGKVCTECFNDFGIDLELTEKWERYVVPFASMRQLGGWGSPHPKGVDPSKLYGLQWQVNTPGASYDVWIDDVEFTGCQ